MSENQWLFKVEDIFEDIPGDSDNVLMNIPPEISKKMGWQPGDTLKILIGDQGTVIIEKVEEKENRGKEEKDTDK